MIILVLIIIKFNLLLMNLENKYYQFIKIQELLNGIQVINKKIKKVINVNFLAQIVIKLNQVKLHQKVTSFFLNIHLHSVELLERL